VSKATKKEANEEIVTAAFGQKNRVRLLDEYFTSRPVPTTAATAWSHVYQLLLWTDLTTGLAHCYESDKTQPGKPWYGRSLAFHSWLASAFNTLPSKVSERIDWMFQKAARALAAEVLHKAKAMSAVASRQWQPFAGKGFPSPGEDPELVVIIKEVLGDHFASEPSPEKWRELVQRIRQYLTLDNKRKNLLGEGFEDVLGTLVERSCPQSVKVHVRRLLPELPGFSPMKKNDKPNRVDLAIIRPRMRTLVTAKWSVRADREKQFGSDFTEYVTANSDNKPFEYVFVTNEFDPARLMRACEKFAANALMFSHVVHINTDALRATYGQAQEESMKKVLGFIDDGRLISLEGWLGMLAK
jgi:hypothetical protein